MKIIDVTGVTSQEGKVVETPTQKLVVMFTAAVPADVQNEFEAIKFETSVTTKQGGSKTLVPRTPIADLAEIAASNEGFVKIMEGGKVLFSIELSNHGSLDLGENQLTVSFYNLLAGSRLQVWALDSPYLVSEHIKYSAFSFNANAAKEIDCSDYYQLCLPVASLEKVELSYPNGRSISYTPDELNLICNEINELAYIEQVTAPADLFDNEVFALTAGSKNWYCIGIDDALRCKITLTDTAIVYLVKDDDLNF